MYPIVRHLGCHHAKFELGRVQPGAAGKKLFEDRRGAALQVAQSVLGTAHREQAEDTMSGAVQRRRRKQTRAAMWKAATALPIGCAGITAQDDFG